MLTLTAHTQNARTYLEMCILFLHVNPDATPADYRLIVAANRDEYYKRPALDAHQHPSGIIGGEDMQPGRENGMWLGVAPKTTPDTQQHYYCFAALLNITGEKVANASGRGFMVVDCLKSTPKTEQQFVENLKRSPEIYNGYNFVAVELSKTDAHIFHTSNTPRESHVFHGKQTLGFGNSPVTTPLTKVRLGQRKFEEIIRKPQEKDQLVQDLLTLLKDETSCLPDEELEKRAPAAYEFLSSIFVKIEPAGYGTRAHTVILVDYDWNLVFVEQAMEQPIDSSKPTWKTSTIKSNL